MTETILSTLPAVRGTYRTNVLLAPTNWLRVGGPADILFKPADVEDLAHFLQENSSGAQLPCTVLGVGSNVLIRDGGIEGVVIKLGAGFTELSIQGKTLTAGAGLLGGQVAKVAAEAGLSGLEFLVGIPGTIGGALAMNAGAYGQEVKDRLIHATVISPEGIIHTLPVADIGYYYRGHSMPAGWIFVGATFALEPGDAATILAHMENIMTKRAATQPVRSRTAGSTFRNPPGAQVWELIDKVGLRGTIIGGAQFSELHCNFIINTGTATAATLEQLGELAREKVHTAYGITLEWEVVRLGRTLE